MLRMEEVVREWDGGGGEANEQGLPPGFRFHPTDEELITFYLASKVFHGTFSGVDIPQVDLNRCEPWDLPESAKMGGIEWYFFSVRDRKYPTGLRTNRATGAGYWKATGKDRRVYGAVNGALLGMKKTLVFYRGRAPRGLKTRWVMHEYRLDGHFSCRHTSKEEWVICKIFHKPGQKRRPQVQAQPPPSPPPFPNIINSPPALLEPPPPAPPPPPPDSLHLNPFLIHQHLKYLPTSLDHLSSEPNLFLLNSPQASFPRPTFPPSTTTTTTAVNKVTATNHHLPSINFKSLLWHQDYCCTNGKEQYQPQPKQPTAAAATTIAKQCKTEANFPRILQVPRDSHNINNNINLQFSQSHWLHRSSQISPPQSLSPCPPQYPLDFGTDWSGFDFRADVAALEVAASGVELRLSVEAPHIEVAGESWP